MTAIKEEILDIEEVSIHIIKTMLKLYPDQIISRYNLTDTSDTIDILDQIGKKIGAVRNKETDYEKVYTTILKKLVLKGMKSLISLNLRNMNHRHVNKLLHRHLMYLLYLLLL